MRVRSVFFFVLLSGLGWLCDFATFTLLVKFFDVPGGLANFGSSYVGVTFVWFTSLKAVFGRTGAARGRFLFSYWAFQFVSILAYSQFLQWVSLGVQGAILIPILTMNAAITAKVFITPFNLVTNFLFMKWLTRFMQQAKPEHC